MSEKNLEATEIYRYHFSGTISHLSTGKYSRAYLSGGVIKHLEVELG
jgi:hypothetical protein